MSSRTPRSNSNTVATNRLRLESLRCHFRVIDVSTPHHIRTRQQCELLLMIFDFVYDHDDIYRDVLIAYCMVILINSHSTPLSAVVSQLSWSRDCELEVVIARRAFHDGHKRAKIVALMNILRFRIQRFRGLCFDIMFSSSLLFLPINFHGNTITVEHLELKCGEDDGRPDQSESFALVNDFQWPNLNVLS